MPQELYDDILGSINGGSGSQKTTTPNTGTTNNYSTLLQTYLKQLQGSKAPGMGDVNDYANDAKKLLGDMDTTGFDELKAAYESQYKTGVLSNQQAYDNLLNELGKQNTQNKEAFAQGRGTISEGAFTRGREQYRNIAQRGLGGSGLQQLGDVQNKMETGQQVNSLANSFYKTSENLADAEVKGTQNKTMTDQQLADQQAMNLASVNNQEIQYKNAYQEKLGSLALQLQSNAYAGAMGSYTANLQNDQMEFGIEGELAKQKDFMNSTEGKYSIIKDTGTTEADKIAKWMDTYSVDAETAKQQVNSYTSSYKTQLTQEVLSNFDVQLDRSNSFGDVSKVLKGLQEMYDTGKVSEEDIKMYMSNNWDKISSKSNFTDNGLVDGLLTSASDFIVQPFNWLGDIGAGIDGKSQFTYTKRDLMDAVKTGNKDSGIKALMNYFNIGKNPKVRK